MKSCLKKECSEEEERLSRAAATKKKLLQSGSEMRVGGANFSVVMMFLCVFFQLKASSHCVIATLCK